MATRTVTESKEHIALIQMMANYFEKLGYTDIKADIAEYEKPAQITYQGFNYIPDLTCKMNNSYKTRIILEAETCKTINSSHTSGQWKAFANASGEFHIVVPKKCGTEAGRSKATNILKTLKIKADEIWTPN